MRFFRMFSAVLLILGLSDDLGICEPAAKDCAPHALSFALVQRFAKRFKINYPVVMGGEEIANDFGGIGAIPTTFVLEREGRIVSKHIGYVDKAVFESEVKALL